MKGVEVASTLLPSYVKLCLDDCTKFDAEKVEMVKMPYFSIVGSLMYAMICMRPSIVYAMGGVNRVIVLSW